MGIDEIQPSRRPQTVQKGRRSYLCPSSTAPAALFGSHESGLAYFVQDIHLTSAHHSHLCRVGMTDLGTAPSPDTREPTSWLARCYPRSSAIANYTTIQKVPRHPILKRRDVNPPPPTLSPSIGFTTRLAGHKSTAAQFQYPYPRQPREDTTKTSSGEGIAPAIPSPSLDKPSVAIHGLLGGSPTYPPRHMYARRGEVRRGVAGSGSWRGGELAMYVNR